MGLGVLSLGLKYAQTVLFGGEQNRFLFIEMPHLFAVPNVCVFFNPQSQDTSLIRTQDTSLIRTPYSVP